MRVYSLLRPHHSTFPNHWLIYQTWRCFMGKTWKTQVAWNGENTDHFEETNSHWERCFSIVMIYFLCICTCTCTCICIRIRMCICICEHICTIYIHINISKVHCSSSQIHHRSRCTNTTCPFLSVRDIVWCNAGAHDAARGPWRLIRIPSCATASQPKVTWINQGYSVKRIRAWNMFFFFNRKTMENSESQQEISISKIRNPLHAWEASTIFVPFTIQQTCDGYKSLMIEWRERSLLYFANFVFGWPLLHLNIFTLNGGRVYIDDGRSHAYQQARSYCCVFFSVRSVSWVLVG